MIKINLYKALIVLISIDAIKTCSWKEEDNKKYSVFENDFQDFQDTRWVGRGSYPSAEMQSVYL